jgi:hypothetical protein
MRFEGSGPSNKRSRRAICGENRAEHFAKEVFRLPTWGGSISLGLKPGFRMFV